MFTGKFGVEMECYNVDRDIVAATLRNAGINAVVAGYSGSNYAAWQIKTDGSISERTGFEVVSRVLQGEDGLAEVAKVCDILESLGAKVNASCGMHIHHDVTGWGIDNFKSLYKRFIKFEGALDSIQPDGRRGNNNRYCQSNIRGGSISDTFKKINACTCIRLLQGVYGGMRYFKLNLESYFRQGSVEFRNHAGTVNAEKVCNYVRLTGAMVQAANDKVVVKEWTREVTPEYALNVLLKANVSKGRISGSVAKFYKKRQAHFA